MQTVLKHNGFFIKFLFITLFLLSMTFFVSSCGYDAPNYDDSEVTEDELEELLDWGDDHKIKRKDLQNLYYTKVSGVFRKNASTNQTFYYYFDDSELGGKCESALNRIQSMYINVNDAIEISISFVKADNSSCTNMTSEYTNSIGDRTMSFADISIDSTVGGKIHYHYSDTNKTTISASQIWIPKTSCQSSEGYLQAVLLHELGHSLGLKDIEDSNYQKETIMWHKDTYLKNRTTSQFFYNLDILAINELY